jgi:hypothetical protein
MRSILYRVTFVGGPSDGLVVRMMRSSFRPRKMLSLSVSPILVRHENTSVYEYVGESRSIYKMTSRQYREVGGVPTFRLRYDFLNVEHILRPAVGPRTQGLCNNRFMRFRACSRRAWNRLVCWLLSPVDSLLNPSPRP